MYFRVKRSGAYPYLQVVQSYRDGQQVRQHVIAPSSTVKKLSRL